jgi:hypothetical protein
VLLHTHRQPDRHSMQHDMMPKHAHVICITILELCAL